MTSLFNRLGPRLVREAGRLLKRLMGERAGGAKAQGAGLRRLEP